MKGRPEEGALERKDGRGSELDGQKTARISTLIQDAYSVHTGHPYTSGLDKLYGPKL